MRKRINPAGIEGQAIMRNPEPAIGQVWRDADKRFQDHPRFFRIKRVDRESAICRNCDPTTGEFKPGSRDNEIRVENLKRPNRYQFSGITVV